MKKFNMAWVSIPGASYVQLGSTDTNLIKWFLDEIKEIAPYYEYRKDFDLDGNQTYCMVHKLKGRDKNICYWLIEKLLQMGWEPFSVTARGENPSTDIIYLRQEIIDNK